MVDITQEKLNWLWQVGNNGSENDLLSAYRLYGTTDEVLQKILEGANALYYLAERRRGHSDGKEASKQYPVQKNRIFRTLETYKNEEARKQEEAPIKDQLEKLKNEVTSLRAELVKATETSAPKRPFKQRANGKIFRA